MPGKLGILAAAGPLPGRLVEACRQGGRDFVVVAFRGMTDPALVEGGQVPHFWTRLGAAGRWIDELKRQGAHTLCPAGNIRRPSLFELMPDFKAVRILTRIGFSSLGDDALLTALRRVLQEEGFRLVALHEVIDDFLARPGLLTSTAPDEIAQADIAKAREIAREIGRLDIGQGAVVQHGYVLAVEAAEGTDAMLRRCGPLARPGPGGVLVKAKKPQQDIRLDPPTIGVTTVELAAAAGLRGIVVEAGGAMIIDAEAVRQAADRHGLFVLCLAEGE
jgi:hypothetical protein